MDLNELQSVRDRERQTDKLQQLRESFYADAGTFIQQLHTERDRAVERTDDPFDSAEVRQLSDEIKTAEQTVEAIYEKRVGKIVKAASFAAADLPAEVDGMTVEEQTLFDNLVGNIKDNRRQVLDLLDGEDAAPSTGSSTPASDPSASDPSASGTPSEQASPDAAPADATPHQEHASPGQSQGGEPGTASPSSTDSGDGVTAADVMGAEDSTRTSSQADQSSPDDSGSPPGEAVPPSSEGDTAPPSSEPVDPPVRKDGGQDPATNEAANHSGTQEPAEAERSEVDRQRVQILEDVETFLGFDERDYDLEPDDVVSLPETNADILLERGVAREL